MDSPLKQALDRRGWTLKALKAPGINYSYAYKHYRGWRGMSAEFAVLYERLLGIPRWELRPDLWPAPEPKGEQEVTDGTA